MLTPKQIATLRNFRVSYYPLHRVYAENVDKYLRDEMDVLAEHGYLFVETVPYNRQKLYTLTEKGRHAYLPA